MSNPLLTPAEQAHVDAVHAHNERRLQDADHYPTGHQQPTNALEAMLNWLTKYGYRYGTLAAIAVCGGIHLWNIKQATTPLHSVMPVYGLVACIAYGLICYAVPKASLIRLLFVAGALTTFWIQ